MLIAYYHAGGQNAHASLDIYRLSTRSGCVADIRSARREHVQTIDVSGRRDAEMMAREMGAKPWSF